MRRPVTAGLSTLIATRTTALAAATAGALFLTAAPAYAAPPVDGDLSAFIYDRTGAHAGCHAQPHATEQKNFSSATGKRTATVARNFRGVQAGTVSARGRVENATAGVAVATNGAFDKATFTVEHLVRVNDTNPSLDCRLAAIADSQSSAVLKVRRNGRVKIEWDRGSAGRISHIVVFRNGNPIVDMVRPSAHGSTSFGVHAGSYNVAVRFKTRVNETDLPAGASLTKRAHLKVVFKYHR